MGEVEILHRLFTNAAEDGSWDTAKARIVPLDDHDAGSVLAPTVLEALDDLLKKTSPATTQTAWVVRRFGGAGAQTYACVIASYPDLVDAAEGRSGVLNHARLVPVDAPSFDAAALIETALEFPMGEVCSASSGRRLRAYLDALASEGPVLVRPATVAELQSVSRTIVEDVLLGCLSHMGRRKHIAIAIGDAHPSPLARAWAALPLALQRTSSWAIGVKESCPVDVVFSTSGGTAAADASSRVLVDCVRHYVRLLDEAPETVSAMLANPALSDAIALTVAVQRSALAPELSSIAKSGRGAMAKKEKGTRPEPRGGREAERPEWQPLDSDLLTEMNRQLEAMEKVLRNEMDARLATLEARQPAQFAAGPSSAGASMPWRRIALPLSIAVAILVAVAAWWILRTPGSQRQGQQRPATTTRVESPLTYEEPASTTTPEAPSPTFAQKAVVRAEESTKWAEEWKAVLESEARFASETIRDVANQYGVPDDARSTLIAFADQIARNEDLGSNGRDKLRSLLLECLAAAEDGGFKVKIDGKIADVAPLLEAVKKRYGVTNKSTDPAQKSLQCEIVLRWMAGLEP